VGSPLGIKEELGIILCPFPSKKLKNAARISSLVIITYDFRVRHTGCQRERVFTPQKLRFPRDPVYFASLYLSLPWDSNEGILEGLHPF
jgi:hypothetical protein